MKLFARRAVLEGSSLDLKHSKNNSGDRLTNKKALRIIFVGRKTNIIIGSHVLYIKNHQTTTRQTDVESELEQTDN